MTGTRAEPPNCDACGKPKHKDKDLLKCGRCKQAFYHDRNCQVKDWPKHKARCRQLVQQQKQQQDPDIQLIKVEDSNDKGRCVLATRYFAPGDTVLLEKPAILFDTRLEYFGLLEAFGKASDATREKVLDLHAPAPEEIDSQARKQRHARLEKQRQTYLREHPEHAQALTVTVTQKLLAIIETNAHQLFNASLMPGSDIVDPRQWMGLFCMGSMLEHSCNPTLTMNTTRDGRLELIAEVPIAAGDRVSFSYIEGVLEKCQSQRQATLLEEKHFTCQCDRCLGIDECRPIVGVDCGVCHASSHPLFWHAGKKRYICINGDAIENNNLIESIPEEVQKIDLNLTKQIQTLEQNLESGAPVEDVLAQLIAILTSPQWKECIHPFHWLTMSAHQLLSTMCSARARMQNPPNSSFLRLSVVALLHNIIWMEQMMSILRAKGSRNSSTIVALQDALSTASTTGQTSPLSSSTIATTIERCISNTGMANDDIAVPESDLVSLLTTLCAEQSNNVETTTADVLLTIFYAGQDLILAGHSDLCVLLYQRYHAWFHKLKQPSEDNRSRIDAFLSSQGRTNPFQDLVL